MIKRKDYIGDTTRWFGFCGEEVLLPLGFWPSPTPIQERSVSSTMAYYGKEGGTVGKKMSKENKVGTSRRLLLLQRGLNRRSKHTTATSTNLQNPNTDLVQPKKKLDGFLEKTLTELTVTTTQSTCSTSSLSQSAVNHSFEYPLRRNSSQQTFGSGSYDSGSYGSSGMDESLSTFGTESLSTFATSSQASNPPADLYKEWRDLYGLSTENSDDEADKQAESNDDTDEQEGLCLVETTISHSNDAEVISNDSLNDLLTAQYTLESSTDTMSSQVAMILEDLKENNHPIQTPRDTSCSFNFNLFGNEMLKSVAETVSQMTQHKGTMEVK